MQIFNNLILIYLPGTEPKLKWTTEPAKILAELRSSVGFIAHLSLVTIEGTKVAKTFKLRVAEGGSVEGGCSVTLSYLQSQALMRLLKHCTTLKALK